MKKTIAPTLLLLTFLVNLNTACKKNSAAGDDVEKETVLSKIYENDILVDEFIYNSNKQLKKHILKLGNSYEEYKYDNNGYLVEINKFNSEGSPQKSYHYENDENGRPLIMELIALVEFPEPTLTDRVQYHYDAEGRIIKESWLDPDGSEEIKYSNITWNENGTLQKYEAFDNEGPVPVLTQLYEFSQDTDIPPAVLKIQGYPVNPGFAKFYAKKIRIVNYLAGEISNDNEEKFSDRLYDDNGILLGQKSTTTYFKPVKPDSNRDFTFEYTEL